MNRNNQISSNSYVQDKRSINSSYPQSKLNYSEFHTSEGKSQMYSRGDQRVGMVESGNVEGRAFDHVGYQRSYYGRGGEQVESENKREGFRSSFTEDRQIRESRGDRETRYSPRELRGGGRGKLYS